jgi:hypothetical protein
MLFGDSGERFDGPRRELDGTVREEPAVAFVSLRQFWHFQSFGIFLPSVQQNFKMKGRLDVPGVDQRLVTVRVPSFFPARRTFDKWL